MKKESGLYAILLLATFTLSCREGKREIDPTETFEKTIHLEGEALYFGEEVLMEPSAILNVGDYLITLENSGPSVISIINLKDNRLIKRYGSRGRGPGEFLSPFSLFAINERDIGLFDPMLKKLYRINLDSVLYQDKYLPKVDLDLTKQGKEKSNFKVAPTGNGLFIATGLYKNGRYGIFNQRGEFLKVNFDYPADEKYENVGNIVKGMAYQGTFDVNPYGTHFVSTTSVGGVLEILEIKENEVKKVKDLHYFLPKYKNSSTWEGISPESKIGFLDVTVGDKYIFTLYSGKIIKEEKAHLSSTILIFNWKGDQIIQIKTDKELRYISIDEEKMHLYGIIQTPTPGLVKYDLSEHLNYGRE